MRGELGTLSKENALQVARHLVMTFQLLDEDPQSALLHAMAAQRRAGRVGLVREAAGLAAYRAGEYEQALRELRTARRLTGSQDNLPVMADCERGLGRPERALALATGAEARQLDRAGQLELLMVAAGARQDLAQYDAAVVMLQVPELNTPTAVSHARLLSAYADALQAAGRTDEAIEWLEKAAEADVTGETGAAERLGIMDVEGIADLENASEDLVGDGDIPVSGDQAVVEGGDQRGGEEERGGDDEPVRDDERGLATDTGRLEAGMLAAPPPLFSDQPGAPGDAPTDEPERSTEETKDQANG